jgi:CopA family copper-resistance protein
MVYPNSLDRRAFLGGGAALAAAAGLQPAWARSVSHGLAAKAQGVLSGEDIRLVIDRAMLMVDGKASHAVAVNGSIPAPLIRLKEGQNVRITVENRLTDEDTSIHWHGFIVPFQMDGVPGISFPGVRPGQSFTYEFQVKQSGTYWYHSHSGLQEQLGHHGPIIIDPAAPDPVPYDREHVLVLSDWTSMHPHALFTRLRQDSGFFNRNRRTLADRMSGKHDPLSAADRKMFADMRMDPTDISDVTAAAYTYTINGHGPADNWTGLFNAGERVRLRIINAAAQTIFNFRIPGLKLLVVATDGIDVRPVEIDELQIGNAETYDLIVVPEDRAYTIVTESIDRSGMGVATLAPRARMRAEVPLLRERPTLTMADMGMGGMDQGGGHAGHGMTAGAPMDHNMRDKSKVEFKVDAGVDMIAPMPTDRSGDPGIGLDNVGHRVLTYKDLVALKPNTDPRVPTRRIDIHLTGNMERFMWSMDGEKMSENPEPFRFARNERVRLRLINDTMMTHPMHLHGHFVEIVNGNPGFQPLKHTVRVLPGSYLDLDLTADAPGDWAFHCHLLYHMHAGMMRVVSIRPMDGAAA